MSKKKLKSFISIFLIITILLSMLPVFQTTAVAATSNNDDTPSEAQIATGLSHSLVMGADGAIWAWGRNNYGQLGDGTTTTRTSPVMIDGLTNIKAIASGGTHSLALKSDGTVWA